MIFCNETDNYVHLRVNDIDKTLAPNETSEICCSSPVTVSLTHSYVSTALSEKDIAYDDLDASLVSLVIAPHKKPYFDIVLDCVYQIEFEQETEVRIQNERIRPIYHCSYDRLYPLIEQGRVIEKTHTFKQKKEFEQHYLNAISRANRKIVTILLIILALICLPLVILFLKANLLVGCVTVVVVSAILSFVGFIGNLICKLICKANCSLVYSDFESDRIIGHFSKNKTKG